MEVIQVSELSKSYKNRVALDNLSLTVEKGKVLGLLGANGAGKSTAIECILGTKYPDRGTSCILGMDPEKERKKLFQRVGVQFQEANYQETIKVGELCKVTASFYQKSADIHTLLERFSLENRTNDYVKELSGGQKQRLFIVFALIPLLEVVFLDELTTGLDARARRDVWNILLKLKEEGLTILLTSHFMDEVEVLCDEVCILNSGRVVFLGTIEQAIHNSPYDTLEDAYLWYTKEDENESI